MRKLNVISLIALSALAPSAFAQSGFWVLISSSMNLDATPYELSAFVTYSGGTYPGETKNVGNYFIVTGDSTQEPGWGALFGSLADNEWTVEYVIPEQEVPAQTTRHFVVERDQRSGHETWQNYSNQLAYRELSMFVTDQLSYYDTGF